MTEPITIYGVYINSDMTEGRGPMRLGAAFIREDDAWEYADTFSGVMGRKPNGGTWRHQKYGDVQVRPITVYQSLEQATEKAIATERAAALSKLTEREKQVLGLATERKTPPDTQNTGS